MKTLALYHCKPTALHIELAREYGGDTLDSPPPERFYADCPEVPGFERAEPGCLISMERSIHPHTDTWLGDFGVSPRRQRSFFWLLMGAATFKVDGSRRLAMKPGEWVVFDHRREHLVLADSPWLGVAWQLQTSRRGPNG